MKFTAQGTWKVELDTDNYDQDIFEGVDMTDLEAVFNALQDNDRIDPDDIIYKVNSIDNG